MRDSRKKLRTRCSGNYAGRPRVVNDHEAYAVVAQICSGGKEGSARDVVKELGEYIRLWSTPYDDWQLGVITARAQMFLGCMRRELGRRNKVDPNQLKLIETGRA